MSRLRHLNRYPIRFAEREIVQSQQRAGCKGGNSGLRATQRFILWSTPKRLYLARIPSDDPVDCAKARPLP